MSHFILQDWAQQHAFAAEAVVEMRRVLGSITAYRKQCGYPSGRSDMTFRAGWHPSCEELFVFVESLLFDVVYDSFLKDALVKGSRPADCVASYLGEYLEPVAKLADQDKESVDWGSVNRFRKKTRLLHESSFQHGVMRPPQPCMTSHCQNLLPGDLSSHQDVVRVCADFCCLLCHLCNSGPSLPQSCPNIV